MDSLEEKVEVELTVAEERAQFEKEKLSRRQALARIGFQAGAAAIAALTADELLRKVGKEMQRRASDNKVAQQVAKELNNAGVAFAIPAEIEDDNALIPPGSSCSCAPPTTGSWWKCENCNLIGSKKWPASDCYVGSGLSQAECVTCCGNRFTQCEADYGVGHPACAGKRDDCKSRICGVQP